MDGLIDIRGTITISGINVVPTGEVIILGLPGVPEVNGLVSVNYLSGGKDESFRKGYLGAIAGGKIYLKEINSIGKLSSFYWGTGIGLEPDSTLGIFFAARYFTN